MPLFKFSDQQINYFRFATIVLDEFPKALRQTFVFMWDNKYGGAPTNMPWDDSVAVRNKLRAQERGNPKIPTDLSYTSWDCNALFQATLRAQSFKLPHLPHGHSKTLNDMYVSPLGLARDDFHVNVSSSTGDLAETFALAIDQLRRLRNKTCHSTTESLDKATFDHYVKLSKECFSQLGIDTAVIDNIAGLKEDEFTADKFLEMYEQLRKERDAMNQFLNEVLAEIEKLKEEVSKGKGPDHTPLMSHLPPNVPHFTGRDEECAKIMDHLTIQSTKFVSVWGTPGFGKTSVATAVGNEIDTQGLPILFVSLRKVTTVNEMAIRILIASQQCNQEYPIQLSPIDKVELWLSSVSSPLFLFLDNADGLLEGQKDKFFEFLQSMLESCKSIKLLCTTRGSIEYATHLFETFSIRIRQFDESSSQHLIRALHPSVTESECKRIGEVCGNVPLAIRLVCSVVSSGALSLTEIVNELVSSNTNLLEAVDVTDYPEGFCLKNLFEHCFLNLSPNEQKAFISLSVFNDSFDAAAALAVVDTKGTLEGQKMLGVLVRKSLLEYDVTCHSYSIHPLLQSFGVMIGSTRMQTIYKDAKVRFSGYYLKVFNNLNEQFLTGQSSSAYKDFQREQLNILQALEGASVEAMYVLSQAEVFLDSVYWSTTERNIFEKLYDGAIRVAKQQEQALIHCQLLIAKSFAFLAHGSGESAGLLSEAVKVQESLASVPSEVKGKLQCYIGIDAVVRGDAERGIRLLNEGRSLLRQTAGSSCTDVFALQVLALCGGIVPDSMKGTDEQMHTQGQNEMPSGPMYTCDHGVNVMKEMPHVPTQATMLCGNDSKLPEKSLKEDQPFVLQTVYLLSAVCKVVTAPQQRHKLANYVQEIVKQMETPFAEYTYLDPFYLTTASILRHLGSFKEAQQALQKAVTLKKEVLGQHLDTAQALHELGCTQCSLDDYQNALKSHQEALAIRQKLLGDHVDTAWSIQELGCTQYKSGDYQNALRSHKEALTMREKLLGEHVDTAWSLHSLGCTQYRLDEYQNALKSHNKAVAMRWELLGEHVDTASSLHGLGSTQYQLDDYQKALQAHREAVAMRRKLLGEHVNTASSLHSLGQTQYRLGDYQNAVKSHREALAMRQKLLEEHVDTARSLHSLGCTQYSLGDYPNAVKAHKEALAMRQKLLGKHVDTALSLHSLGCAQYRSDDYEDAVQSHKECIAMRQKLLGEHVDTAWSLHSLGCAQYRLGDYQDAVQSHKEAVVMRQKLLGEHMDTARSLYSLGQTQYRLHDYHNALRSHKEAWTIRQKLLGEHAETADSRRAIGLAKERLKDELTGACSYTTLYPDEARRRRRFCTVL